MLPETVPATAAERAAANKQYFDELHSNPAVDFESIPTNKASIALLKDELLARRAWLGIPVPDSSTTTSPTSDLRLLDYACGTGAIGLTLANSFAAVRGVDVSGGSVQKFNERAEQSGLAPQRVRAFEGDLLGEVEKVDGGDVGGEEWREFDFVGVGLAFHHFEDPTEAVRRLARRLKAGGVFFITDMEEVKGEGHGHGHSHNHGHSHGHGHGHGAANEASQKEDEVLNMKQDFKKAVKVHGFTYDGIKKVFEDGGLTDVEISKMDPDFLVEWGNPRTIMKRRLFFVKGRKPA